jgi:tetratricopeptide (TPR) repeat protein
MDFVTYHSKAWQDHAAEASRVASDFPTGLGLAKTADDLTKMAGLVTHVAGEHLAKWQMGIDTLKGIRKHTAYSQDSELEKAIVRSIAALEVGSGQEVDHDTFSQSDLIRVLAVASSALSERDTQRATSLLNQALDLAQRGLEQADPANRALAVTGNNLAAALEEKPNRTAQETELMIFAAHAGRKFWQIAGTWVEVMRAEYRLSMSYLKANRLQDAFLHVQTSIEFGQENGALPIDLFFGFEALALVERAKGNVIGHQAAVEKAEEYFGKMIPENQTWCKAYLDKIR